MTADRSAHGATNTREAQPDRGLVAWLDLGDTFSGGSGAPLHAPFAVPSTEGPEKPDKFCSNPAWPTGPFTKKTKEVR